MERPRVSVITIFLDEERFLGEAIASVFAQRYDAWELLLVDDGSTDGGTELARACAAAHPERVRYLEHPGHANRGMSASRNLGIAAARGEYLALLDADDVWLPDKLERQVAILDRLPEAGMVFGRSLYWFGWTGRSLDAARDLAPSYAVEPGTLVDPPGLLLTNYPLGAGPAPCPSDILFRSAVIARAGKFDESFTGELQAYEDQVFLVQVYLKEKVFVSGEIWDRYRQHPSSCVSVVKRAGHYDRVRLHFLNWFEEYLDRIGVRDDRIRAALGRARWPYDHRIRVAALNLCKRLYGKVRRSAASLARLVRRLRPDPMSGPARATGRR